MSAKLLYKIFHSPNQRITQGWEDKKGLQGPFLLNKYFMEINWNTDKLVLLYYAVGASGKFLHGCLAISSQVEFQHKELLGCFESTLDKFEFFCDRILPADGSKSKPDFGLGCNRLLNLSKGPNYNIPDTLEIQRILETSSTLPALTNGNNYFFIVAHEPIQLPVLLKIFPNSKIIQLHNSLEWIQHRKIQLSKKLPPELFDNTSLIPTQYTTDRLLKFDVNSFFNKQLFLAQIENLYKKLNLIDFNSVYMQTLFDLYHTLINQQRLL